MKHKFDFQLKVQRKRLKCVRSSEMRGHVVQVSAGLHNNADSGLHLSETDQDSDGRTSRLSKENEIIFTHACAGCVDRSEPIRK